MGPRRVVVTGLGVVSPIGTTVEETWRNAIEGHSGIGPLEHFDCSKFPTRIAGTIKNFEAERYVSLKDLRKMDPFIQYALAAGLDAFEDSALQVTEEDAPRFGALIGSGVGGLGLIETNYEIYRQTGSSRRMSPFTVPGSNISMAAGHLSIRLGLQGPSYGLMAACSTSTHAVGLAARTIVYGEADVMLAGGAESASTPTSVGGFCSARALSQRNDEPEKASRPWDRDRDGFVLSDGAAVLVLEEFEHAKRRGAKIYAELLGFGTASDAYHITTPREDGKGKTLAMGNALADAGINAEDIGYINAHGTSTQVGDFAETVAIKKTFGSAARLIPCSSTKSVTGHLLGASGGIEAMFTVLALHHQVLPPTINLDNPDEGCDLDYVPHTAREVKGVRYAMSNSFGFGGTNGSLVFGLLP
ncbi:MAG: beta-ketoacyl-ACP synthase II [Gammaproteobacteria bacterium]